MKLWACVIVPVLLLAALPVRGAIITAPFVEGLRAASDEVAEGTVLAARLLTYRTSGETRVCGASYDMLVDDFVTGNAPRRLTLATYFWSGTNQMRALVSRYGLSLGRTYFFGISHNAVQRMTLDTLVRHASGDDKPHPEIRACMSKLPHDFVVGPLEILGDPADPSSQYVRIHATGDVDPSDVQGTFRENYTPSKPAPPFTGTITTSSAALEMQELNYDQQVSIDALKRMFGLGDNANAGGP